MAALPRGMNSTPASPLRAIPTTYNGFKFRSRLEARWGVFLDTLGLAYTYEPEGFELPSGQRYLPDFYIPTLDVWLEVKGPAPKESDADFQRWLEFANHQQSQNTTALIVWGQHPDPRQLGPSGHPQSQLADKSPAVSFGIFPNHDIDGWAWCICPWCGQPGLAYEARGARVCGWRSHHDTFEEAAAALGVKATTDFDRICTGDAPIIKAAYRAARKARFEFGERG